jgi:hypothetical protein
MIIYFILVFLFYGKNSGVVRANLYLCTRKFK